MQGKLTWGIHKHTLMSRDIGEPIFVSSIEDAKQKVSTLKDEFRQMGYCIWFANYWDENGPETHLVNHHCDSRCEEIL